ncbi:unnamed protein product [Meganyctiphanes norvegica]|uniref:Uncharacterized protein n=1 Tax=Meganyctiphanes norvegica TaxID=48144 RepID=A0AAV2QP31_MEGNR
MDGGFAGGRGRGRREHQLSEVPRGPPERHQQQQQPPPQQQQTQQQQQQTAEEEAQESGVALSHGRREASIGRSSDVGDRKDGRVDVSGSTVGETGPGSAPGDGPHNSGQGSDGELWEYDPTRGSWVRRTDSLLADARVTTPTPTTTSTPAATPTTPTTPGRQNISLSVAATTPELLGSKKNKSAMDTSLLDESGASNLEMSKKRGASDEPGVVDATPPPHSAANTSSNIISPNKKIRLDSLDGGDDTAEGGLQDTVETFSDFSDDADDILNQEVVGSMHDEESRGGASAVGGAGGDNSVGGPATDSMAAAAVVDAASYEDLLEEPCDFEEISDDELEDDRQAKFSVADALDINWAMLAADSRPVEPNPDEAQATGALARFNTANLFKRIGVSTKYARPHVIEAITKACKEHDPDMNEVPAVVSKGPFGGVKRLMAAKEQERHRIIHSVGPNRRALCARYDIALRRQLCNLPGQELVGENVYLDRGLFKQATNLLKSC